MVYKFMDKRKQSIIWGLCIVTGFSALIFFSYFASRDVADNVSNTVILSLALIGLFIDAILVINLFMPDKEMRKLRKTHTRCIGIITEIKIASDVKGKGRPPFRAVCVLENSRTNTTSTFESDVVYSDIRGIEGAQVDVYLNNNNPYDYFIDTKKSIEQFYKRTSTIDLRNRSY